MKEKEIKIPPGYTDLREWKKQHPEVRDPLDPKLKDRIRIYNNAICYVLDPNNPDYLEFQNQCREDTRALKKTLQRELDARKIPVWVNGKIPKKRKAHTKRRMLFLIRPPYFSSLPETNETKRMQANDDIDTFCLHFDQEHRLQTIRCWNPKPKRKGAYNKFVFRDDMLMALLEQEEFFEQNYGDWETFVKKMADIIKANVENIKENEQEDPVAD